MSENRYLSGNFAPVTEEHTAFDLPVTGSIPRELEGRLLRIGPNPVEADPEHYHWFTGNGMVHGLQLRGGKAEWYRNRYVRDEDVVRVKGGSPVPGPVGALGGTTANTNVVGIGGKTYAIVEAGNMPVELTNELETVQRSDFGGTLPSGFTAHPKRDPDTGELHAAVYSPLTEILQYIVVGTDGAVRKQVDVPVPGSPMVHDCSITENYFVLFDLPVTFDPENLVEGGLPYRWNPDYGARVGLLPREGSASDVVWCEVEPCYVYHPMNSYEDNDGRVVIDVVRHPRMFATDFNGPNEGVPTLDRWVVDPKGGPVKEARLDERGQEFPRIDERLIGKPYRYGYTTRLGEGFEMGSLVKHDLREGTTQCHTEGEGRAFLEPVFVPASDDSAEDEGWVLAHVYDASVNRSDVVILNAQDFEAGPVATIHLPARVPFGFHGNWVPDA
jgi:carotenoid cleavage dioxygenase-like enzyme